jgi:acid phosphatase (class A)
VRHPAIIFALILAIGLASPAFADGAKPFADAKEIDLLTLLPTPLANDTAQMKADQAEGRHPCSQRWR